MGIKMRFLLSILLLVLCFGTVLGDPPPGWPPPSYVMERQWQNIMDYGAKGDGTTDDRAAIQAALDAVPDSGGCVFVPHSDSGFLIDTTLIIKSYTTLLGVGRGSKILLDPSLDTPFTMITNTHWDGSPPADSGIVIDGIYWDMGRNYTIYDETSTWNQAGIVEIRYAHKCIVRNCFLTRSHKDGIAFRHTEDSKILNNVLWDMGEEALAVAKSVGKRNIVSGNHCIMRDSSYTGQEGEWIAGQLPAAMVLVSGNTTISDNIFRYGGGGIDMYQNTNPALEIDTTSTIIISNNQFVDIVLHNCISPKRGYNLIISGNVFRNCNANGINCWGAGGWEHGQAGPDSTPHDILITGNQFLDHHKFGIVAAGGHGYTITNNVFSNLDTTAIECYADRSVITGNRITEVAGGYGIHLTAQRNSIISDNQIAYVDKSGIYSETFSVAHEYLSITGNSVRDCGEYGIDVLSLGFSTVSNNVCVGNALGGIHLSNSDYNVVSDNVCRNSPDSTQAYGILLESNSNKNIIHSNMLGGNVTAAISGGSDNAKYGNREDTTGVAIFSVDDSIKIGNYSQTGTIGTDGYVLTTDGAGWARWVAAPGAGSGDDIKIDTGDASVQVVDIVNPIFQEGSNIQFTIIGSDTVEIAGAGGEANTISDTGTYNDTEGFGLAGGKTGVSLKVKGLIEGSNITITKSGDSALTFAATPGSGFWAFRDSTTIVYVNDSTGDTNVFIQDTTGFRGLRVSGIIADTLTINNWIEVPSLYGDEVGSYKIRMFDTVAFKQRPYYAGVTMVCDADSVFITMEHIKKLISDSVAAGGSGIWVVSNDTSFLVDADGDTLAALWDDDAGNVRWQVGTEDQTLRILVDTIGIGGDVIYSFTGTNLSVTDGVLNAAIGGAGGWTDDGNYIRLTAIGDSVGIGTATPTSKLQVDGEIKAPIITISNYIGIAGNYIEELVGPSLDDSAGILIVKDNAITAVKVGDSAITVGKIDHSDAETNWLNAVYQALEATLTDIADGTINENLVNTANPWADNEVADALTVTGYMQDEDINTFAELQSWVSDKTLLNEEEVATIDVAWTFAALLAADSINTAHLVCGSVYLGNDTLKGIDVFVVDTVVVDGDVIKDFTGTNLSVTNGVLNAAGGGNGLDSAEVVTIVSDSGFLDIDDANVDTAHWNAAWVWGDHSTQNYLDNDDANVDTTGWSKGRDSGLVAWNWGDHSAAGYLGGLNELFGYFDRTYFDTAADAGGDSIICVYSDSSDLSIFDTDDLTEGSSNKYDQALPDSSEWSIAYDSSQHDYLRSAELTTSAHLAGLLSNETGTGVSVFGTSPTISGPTLTLETGVGSSDQARILWNTTKDAIVVGTGGGEPQIKTFYAGAHEDSTRILLTDRVDTTTGGIVLHGGADIVMVGTETVDGVDVSELQTDFTTDSTKLDGIEAGATADQTDAEIEAIIGPFIDTTTLDTIANAHDAVHADSSDKVDTTTYTNVWVHENGDTMSGVLHMGANKISGLADPASDSDAVPKSYVDSGAIDVSDLMVEGDIGLTGRFNQWGYGCVADLDYAHAVVPDTWIYFPSWYEGWDDAADTAHCMDSSLVIHPAEVHVPNGLWGYKSWMGYGPYCGQAGGGEVTENPHIAVSNDGITYHEFYSGNDTLHNPLWTQNDTFTFGTDSFYNITNLSDQDLFYAADQKLYMPFRARWEIGGLDSHAVFVGGTSDGITWADPKPILSNGIVGGSPYWFMSPCFLHVPDTYNMWTVEYPDDGAAGDTGWVVLWQSEWPDTGYALVDTVDWTASDDSAKPWHIEVIANGADELIFLVTECHFDNAGGGSWLSLAYSHDGGRTVVTNPTIVMQATAGDSGIADGDIYRATGHWEDQAERSVLKLYATVKGHPQGVGHPIHEHIVLTEISFAHYDTTGPELDQFVVNRVEDTAWLLADTGAGQSPGDIVSTNWIRDSIGFIDTGDGQAAGDLASANWIRDSMAAIGHTHTDTITEPIAFKIVHGNLGTPGDSVELSLEVHDALVAFLCRDTILGTSDQTDTVVLSIASMPHGILRIDSVTLIYRMNSTTAASIVIDKMLLRGPATASLIADSTYIDSTTDVSPASADTWTSRTWGTMSGGGGAAGKAIYAVGEQAVIAFVVYGDAGYYVDIHTVTAWCSIKKEAL